LEIHKKVSQKLNLLKGGKAGFTPPPLYENKQFMDTASRASETLRPQQATRKAASIG